MDMTSGIVQASCRDRSPDDKDPPPPYNENHQYYGTSLSTTSSRAMFVIGVLGGSNRQDVVVRFRV